MHQLEDRRQSMVNCVILAPAFHAIKEKRMPFSLIDCAAIVGIRDIN